MRLGRIVNWTEDGFNTAKAQGLDFVEICCNSQELGEEFISLKDKMKRLIAETGLDISSVGRWNHDVSADGKLIPERVESYHKLLDTAEELGAKTFVCGINYDKSISLYKNYKNAIEFFGGLVEHAAPLNVKVALQNCSWNNFVVEPEQWKVILGEIPELMIKYDPSHAYNRGASYLDELSDWGSRVAHVHIKGTVHAGKNPVSDPPAGMDDILWPSVFAILYAKEYKGDLSIEPHSSIWHGELGNSGVLFTRDYIRKFLF